MVGKSTSGNWLMPMRDTATRPKTMVAAISIQAKTGFLRQASVRLTARSVTSWRERSAATRPPRRVVPRRPRRRAAARRPRRRVVTRRRRRGAPSGRRAGRGGAGVCASLGVARPGLASRHAAWRRDADLRPLAQRLGAARHQELSHGEARLDLDAPVGRAQPQREHALAGGGAVDHVREEPPLARSHGRQWDHGSVAARAHGHGHLGEGAGAEQLLALALHLAGHGDHARRGIRRVGDVRQPGAVGPLVALHGEARLHVGPDPQGVGGGDLEAEQERVAAQERREHGADRHVLARLHGARLDLPLDGART